MARLVPSWITQTSNEKVQLPLYRSIECLFLIQKWTVYVRLKQNHVTWKAVETSVCFWSLDEDMHDFIDRTAVIQRNAFHCWWNGWQAAKQSYVLPGYRYIASYTICGNDVFCQPFQTNQLCAYHTIIGTARKELWQRRCGHHHW